MINKSSAGTISLPQGGGALQGLGEKFSPDLQTGTGNFTMPIALPPGRSRFQPQLNLAYSTGSGNGPFSLGWSLSLPGVTRKTSQGLQMTGNERSHSLRYALNSQCKAVVLVSGSTRERDAVFRGFTSPLLPEILICTHVGQEGIDLHRHCRHVVHYDLGWIPATIEQRTRRVDWIGSKTQRERRTPFKTWPYQKCVAGVGSRASTLSLVSKVVRWGRTKLRLYLPRQH